MVDGSSPKGWYSRRYLPHCDTPGLIQAITFRLADALPAGALQRIREDSGNSDGKRERMEILLDAGHGACLLRDARLARIVETALLHFDGERYRLLAWCVMPNHVHVLIETLSPDSAGKMPALQQSGSAGVSPAERLSLPAIVHSWKSFTAKEINRILGGGGLVWQRDFFDRYIRDDAHLAATITYIHENPVKAGLVTQAEKWPFSSAHLTR